MTETDLKPGCSVVKWDRERTRTAVRKCRAETGGCPWFIGAVLCPLESELLESYGFKIAIPPDNCDILWEDRDSAKVNLAPDIL